MESYVDQLDELFCTCQRNIDPWVHEGDCDLWEAQEFLDEFVKWSPEEQRLVPANGEKRSDADWDLLMQLDEQAEQGVEAVVLEIVEFDPPEDPDSYAKQRAWAQYRCWCITERLLSCDECGVVRDKSTDPWKPDKARTLYEGKYGVHYECECTPPAVYKCKKCEVQRWSKQYPWTYYYPADDWAYGVGDTWAYGGATQYVQKCRHTMAELVFPDGTKAYASSCNARGKEDDNPDLGIYMASSWSPTSKALWLNWQDYGLPQIPIEDVRWTIETARNFTTKGLVVEFGCIGGHGRTGSALALLALHSGVESAEAAIKFVRDTYCSHAIEGTKQEWYVKKYDAVLKGTEVPPMPVELPYKSSGVHVLSSDTKTKPLLNQVTCKKVFELSKTVTVEVDSNGTCWIPRQADQEKDTYVGQILVNTNQSLRAAYKVVNSMVMKRDDQHQNGTSIVSWTAVAQIGD